MTCSVHERGGGTRRYYELVVRSESPEGQRSLSTTYVERDELPGVLARLRELGLKLVGPAGPR